MTLPRIVGLAGVAIFLIYVLPKAKSDEVLSPAAQRGFVILKTNCSRCHAVGKIGESPLKIAPLSAPSTSVILLRTSKNRLRRG
jgi:mono/diheme cytochrome c family protein